MPETGQGPATDEFRKVVSGVAAGSGEALFEDNPDDIDDIDDIDESWLGEPFLTTPVGSLNDGPFSQGEITPGWAAAVQNPVEGTVNSEPVESAEEYQLTRFDNAIVSLRNMAPEKAKVKGFAKKFGAFASAFIGASLLKNYGGDILGWVTGGAGSMKDLASYLWNSIESSVQLPYLALGAAANIVSSVVEKHSSKEPDLKTPTAVGASIAFMPEAGMVESAGSFAAGYFAVEAGKRVMNSVTSRRPEKSTEVKPESGEDSKTVGQKNSKPNRATKKAARDLAVQQQRLDSTKPKSEPNNTSKSFMDDL